eukprot:CAMPEP_0171452544 /NCGR_PEP_ID=MMETSP0945-20130129/608_1 /TAXON_ID=109269 /ORGANISM="Vaucheria litorea, Strain CCMP2940" /LENGTH=217 /DNA_ID=CAMNT_0011977229 /DNA_START=171 /DNA_END=824 /DNA_ORIENTATION=-
MNSGGSFPSASFESKGNEITLTGFKMFEGLTILSKSNDGRRTIQINLTVQSTESEIEYLTKQKIVLSNFPTLLSHFPDLPHLPREEKTKILDFLDGPSLLSLSQTSKELRILILTTENINRILSQLRKEKLEAKRKIEWADRMKWKQSNALRIYPYFPFPEDVLGSFRLPFYSNPFKPNIGDSSVWPWSDDFQLPHAQSRGSILGREWPHFNEFDHA